MNFCRTFYSAIIAVGESLQSVFLLGIRLFWGWQFFIAGKGKLADITPVIDFFTTLQIPYPTISAYLAGGTECFGGLCLLVGFASRLVSIPLAFTMVIAYITADIEAVKAITENPLDFTHKAPFNFLLTAVIIFCFGPGKISVDALLKGRKGS